MANKIRIEHQVTTVEGKVIRDVYVIENINASSRSIYKPEELKALKEEINKIELN